MHNDVKGTSMNLSFDLQLRRFFSCFLSTYNYSCKLMIHMILSTFNFGPLNTFTYFRSCSIQTTVHTLKEPKPFNKIAQLILLKPWILKTSRVSWITCNSLS
ncbi:hypothetical protein AMTRI_Chr08g202460 [Amborella trichopoda]